MTCYWQTFRFDFRDEAHSFLADVIECHRLGLAGIRSFSGVVRGPRKYDVQVQFVGDSPDAPEVQDCGERAIRRARRRHKAAAQREDDGIFVVL